MGNTLTAEEYASQAIGIACWRNGDTTLPSSVEDVLGGEALVFSCTSGKLRNDAILRELCNQPLHLIGQRRKVYSEPDSTYRARQS